MTTAPGTLSLPSQTQTEEISGSAAGEFLMCPLDVTKSSPGVQGFRGGRRASRFRGQIVRYSPVMAENYRGLGYT